MSSHLSASFGPRTSAHFLHERREEERDVGEGGRREGSRGGRGGRNDRDQWTKGSDPREDLNFFL